jgi:hypothetical protein
VQRLESDLEECLTMAGLHGVAAVGKNLQQDGGHQLDSHVRDRSWAWVGERPSQGAVVKQGCHCCGYQRGPQVHYCPWAWAEERLCREAGATKKDGKDGLGLQIHDHPWAWAGGRLSRRVPGSQKQRGQVAVLLRVGP